MRVFVAGATGMLGKHVSEEVHSRGWECVSRSHEGFDIAFPSANREIADIAPDVIINCAGKVPNKDADISGDISMIFSNAIGPRRMAGLGIRLIHMSTDCVFDDTLYGRSKLLGESDSPNVLNVRGSFVCWDSGLLAWLAKQRGKIPGYIHAYWNGTTATHMASVLCDLAEGDRVGIVNVASAVVIRKYDLLCQLVAVLQFPVDVVEEYNHKTLRRLHPDIEVPGGEVIIQELVDQYKICVKP